MVMTHSVQLTLTNALRLPSTSMPEVCLYFDQRIEHSATHPIAQARYGYGAPNGTRVRYFCIVSSWACLRTRSILFQGGREKEDGEKRASAKRYLLKAAMATTSPGATPRPLRLLARRRTLSTNCWPVCCLPPQTVTGDVRRSAAIRFRHWHTCGAEKLPILMTVDYIRQHCISLDYE